MVRGHELVPIRYAAEIIGYKVSTLRKWRLRKIGPPSFRVGGIVMYRTEKLLQWMDEQEKLDPHSNPEIDPANAPVLPKMTRTKKK